ncbi:hypothetical protein H8S90_09535 [Olivibacter sp. SDN3]|uniref:hypothetical protein n=1 Tax=Olivibacter sp. SDN3 TaxID=2764720 RepID=UPI0016518942|nr:hypothetical protein [Olivibacter sp. SDN3]QNL51790.1 hypothetical protein H8S90_09535 [Olivibacter sp. SDN3]
MRSYQMKFINYAAISLALIMLNQFAQAQITPDSIKFVRQATKRMVFDDDQSIQLSTLDPKTIVGLSVMHPVTHYTSEHAKITLEKNELLLIESERESQTAIWLGGFNPFATYTLNLDSGVGDGEVGFEFTSPINAERMVIVEQFKDSLIIGLQLSVFDAEGNLITDESIATANLKEQKVSKGNIILQMLGSGLVLYAKHEGLPKVIGQADFNKYIDLRKKKYIHSFQSRLYAKLKGGAIKVKRAEISLTTGVGLADIRPITYENGEPLLDNGKIWYTMSIRGRALPHHLQGVFSMNPSVFDIKLEGIIVFDRQDSLLRNEIASHIFFDRNDKVWRGVTTGFSAFANPEKEEKQLLLVESETDPRFGFSIMNAKPFNITGDIEDPHILYDAHDKKWRMVACKNQNGYKAIMLESRYWNKNYRQIAGPVTHNSTGTSLQMIGDKRYCFSGSSDKQIYIYTYPDLKEAGTLKMDLPPWDEQAGTRVWPNVVQMPNGYPFKYIALMMDRVNYPEMQEPNWTYGALYLYHGYE